MFRGPVAAFFIVHLLTGVASAQLQQPDRPVDLRVTGAVLAPSETHRDDLVLVDITIQGNPFLLRVGKVEELTTPEKAQVVKNEVLLRKVRFTGPSELMEQLQKPERFGKAIAIEGWLDPRDKRFQVTAVKDASDIAPPSHDN